MNISMKPGVAVIRDASTGRWHYCRDPRRTIVASTLDEILPALQQVDRAVSEEKLTAAGFVSYESAPAFDSALSVKDGTGFPLVWFGLYDGTREMDLSEMLSENRACRFIDWRPSISPEVYRTALERIREYIRCGDTYQVNYTYRLCAAFRDDPWPLFLQLVSAQKAPYGAFVNTGEWALASASPELFFRLDGDRIESRPMKGTASRGRTLEEDERQADALRASEKDQAENVMIVDMARNDLGRIADGGSVTVASLFDVEKYPTVWQMTSTVRAKTAASLPEIFQALFPPASITGAPKARTMEIIAELETTPRRVYTGAIGFIAPRRRAQFNVAIRTVVMNRVQGKAEYGVGGGIVWDSQPEKEVAECRTKAQILRTPPSSFQLLESMLWTPDEGYALLSRHLARLQRSASYFDFALELGAVRRALDKKAAGLPARSHKVRLLVAENGDITVEAGILKTRAPRELQKAAPAAGPVDSSNVFLYHKTTNRWMYEEALAARPGFQDVILYNERGEITESTVANILVEMSGKLFTPPVSCGLLGGTYREQLLEERRIEEKAITLEELFRADRILLINSVRGTVEVDRFALRESTDDLGSR